MLWTPNDLSFIPDPSGVAVPKYKHLFVIIFCVSRIQLFVDFESSVLEVGFMYTNFLYILGSLKPWNIYKFNVFFSFF